jgi:DegV family protein with EDD domain
MQIVTDSGTDLHLPPEELANLNIHVVPLTITLDGRSYREGIDIDPEDFYQLLASSKNLPTTSQPAPGDFAELYRRLAATDPDILSIHISSGLSGTFNSARTAVEMVPEARVTLVDTKTLSAASGWEVTAAARAARAGWPLERILDLLAEIRTQSESAYTLRDLTHLIHGGRISHMKGLVASLLNIKPLIGVEKEKGVYEQLGQARAFTKAMRGLVDLMAKKHAPGSKLRVQVLHSNDPEAAGLLAEQVAERFDCDWQPAGRISLALGAHSGPTMVGVAYAPADLFAQIPA